MRIPQQLPQFIETKAILLVMQPERATVLLAFNGSFETMHTYDESSGNPVRLVERVVSGLSRIHTSVGIDELFISAPKELLGRVQDELPEALQKVVRYRHYGVLNDQEPLTILTRLTVHE